MGYMDKFTTNTARAAEVVRLKKKVSQRVSVVDRSLCECGAYENHFGEVTHYSWCEIGRKKLLASRREHEARLRKTRSGAGGAA